MKNRTYHFWIYSLFFLYLVGKPKLIKAQITSDGSLSTQALTNNKDFIINNGNRIGSNLFHSFREFSVPTGGSASFANAPDVQNIISRVTGTSISNIDGLLRTNGSANLFLINPNGIIFGSNAQLSIGGSFIASTASHLVFADGTQFSVTNLQTPPLLTVSLPIGLQFGQTAKPIQIQRSGLLISPGKTLAMLGGNVLIEGSVLRAPEGRIELGSVGGNSFVSLTSIAEGWKLEYEGVQNFQDIRVSQASLFRTSGEGHGAIQLRGREIEITDKSQVGGTTLEEKPGQPLTIEASESVEVSGFSDLGTRTWGSGASGDIKIETRRLIVRDGGFIDASTDGSGSGGNLIVNASDSVEVLGNGILSNIGTRTLERPIEAGNAGTVQITTRRIVVRDGGQISTSTFGAGNAGTIRVDASESVEVSGRSVINNIDNFVNAPSGLFAESRTLASLVAIGKGGDLIINTQRLAIQGGASISVGAINGSTGQAGRLDINASNSVTVTGTGIDEEGRVVPSTLLARSEGSGSAGNLRINTGSLTVRNSAEVGVNSTGGAIAGNLEITADQLMLNNQGKLTAETTGGQGNIVLNSENLILRQGSQITTNAKGDNITGSNITINTDVLAALEDSDISANSSDFRGGNVIINASAIFGTQLRDEDTLLSDITATGASSSLSGTVQINTPDVDPSSGLIELPVDVVDPTQLIAQGCPANRGNSFTITGRGGLPPLPNEPLRPNNILSVDWVTENQENQRTISPTNNYQLSITQENTEIREANGWIKNNNGEVILIASAPTVTTNGSSLTPNLCF